MSPYEQVEKLYRDYPQQYTFEEDLRRFSKFGYVFSTPDSFIMGYHIPEEDTWFIHALAGDLADTLRYLPFSSEFVTFRRRGGSDRKVSFKRLRAKIRAQ